MMRDDRRQHQQQQQQRQTVGRGVVTASRKYRGHKDGVWDVAVVSICNDDGANGSVNVLGTASAGKINYCIKITYKFIISCKYELIRSNYTSKIAEIVYQTNWPKKYIICTDNQQFQLHE
jgi:hypothetical protein